ncbi:MAG: hypothetical protein L0214_14545 [candidate division NC10 bacterium]|nr:hypothetical protein [candidate division NC10 bacterium]
MRVWGEAARLLTPVRPTATVTPFDPAAPVVTPLLMPAAVLLSPIGSLPLNLTASVLFAPFPGTPSSPLGGEVGAGAARRAGGKGR